MTARPPFQPRTDLPAFPHQVEFAPKIREMRAAALFWKTGTGKTRADIEDTAWLYCNDKIDAQIILAPAEVHRRTWIDQEIPKWLNVPGASALAYKSKSQASKSLWRDLEELPTQPGLRIIAMYFEALSSKSGYEYAKAFAKSAGRVKITVDESHRLMTPGSKVSIAMRHLRDLSEYRRIMTATPTGNGIQDLYAQFAFLGPEILDCATYAEFKGMFVREVQIPETHFKRIVGYSNIKYLNKRIAPYVFVAKKPEGLPPQLWTKVPTTLSEEQWKAYNELRTEYQTQLRTGHWVDGALSIVRLKRLQQIVSGHLPIMDEENEARTKQVLPLDCPRITDTAEVVRGCSDKVIIWAQEHYEIERLQAYFKAQGIGSVMYYGRLKKGVERDANIDQFEDDPAIKVLIANDAIGGTGLTIVGRVAPVADMIFYSHTWSRLLRTQCEGRNHRPGTKAERCTYHDMVAYGTTDPRILKRRQEKDDIAKLVENPAEVAALLDPDLDYQ